MSPSLNRRRERVDDELEHEAGGIRAGLPDEVVARVDSAGRRRRAKRELPADVG